MLFVAWVLKLMVVALALPIDGVAASSELGKRGIPENYIVLFQNAASTPEKAYNDLLQHLKDLGAQVNYQYDSIVKGFSISMDSDYVPKLLNFNNSEYPFIVEADKGVHASQ